MRIYFHRHLMKSFLYLLLVLCLGLGSQGHAQQKSLFSHEAMIGIKRVGAPKMSPNGDWVLYSVGHVYYQSDQNHSDLYLAKSDGSQAPIQLTHNKASESDYFWHPSQHKIYFCSKREGDEANQLYQLDLDKGGEAERLTQLSTGVSGPIISSDGAKVLFQSKVYPKAFSDSAQKKMAEEQKKLKYKARVYTTFPVRYFDQWLDEKQSHLFLLELNKSSKPRDLFESSALVQGPGFGLGGYAFDPLLGAVVFTASTDVHTSAYQSPTFQLYRLSFQPKSTEQLLSKDGYDYSAVRFSPDGKYLLATGNLEQNKVYHLTRLYRFDYPSMDHKVELTSKLDRPINAWEVLGTEILASIEDQGIDKIIRLPYTSSDPSQYTSLSIGDGQGAFSSLSAARTDRFAYSYERLDKPVEVYVHLGDKELPISKQNDAALAKYDLARPEVFWTKTRGKQVRSILVKPANFDPNKKYPLFVLMHGGPAASFKDAFGYRWNPYVLASDQMVIVMTDYTGSVGYGEKFAQDIQLDPFKGPGIEILDAAKDAIQRFSYIDAQRQAAGGASYGGHLANWMQASTTHFKCLVSHAGLMNSEEQWGTSDFVWGRELMNGGAPWVPTKTWKEQNPMRFANQFKTPILYTVGEQDFRVPINNTLTAWSITQRLKIPGKLIVFPEENHWILRPENSRFHYQEIMQWLHHYLK